MTGEEMVAVVLGEQTDTMAMAKTRVGIFALRSWVLCVLAISLTSVVQPHVICDRHC